MRNTRQEEFCNKDRIWLEIVPLKEKGRALAARPDQESKKESTAMEP
jgi:hypothetical protein